MHASKEFSRRHFIRLATCLLSALPGSWAHAAKSRGAGSAWVNDEASLAPGDAPKVIAGLLKGRSLETSDKIRLEVPEAAENGALVPISAGSAISGTRVLHLIADQNPGPRLATFHFAEGVRPWVSTRLKLNASGPVRVLGRPRWGFMSNPGPSGFCLEVVADGRPGSCRRGARFLWLCER